MSDVLVSRSLNTSVKRRAKPVVTTRVLMVRDTCALTAAERPRVVKAPILGASEASGLSVLLRLAGDDLAVTSLSRAVCGGKDQR